jgi:hypothetical protein
MKQQNCEIFVENQLIKAIKDAEHCDIISYIIYLILHIIRLIYILPQELIMKKISSFVILFLYIINAYPQENSLYQTGLTAEQNLNAIGNLARHSTGGVGFDTRYEGIKGSPRLFDKLLPSLLKVKGQDFYMKLETNIDLTTNSLIFMYPKTGKLLVIPSDMIREVKINCEGKEMVFRTASGKTYAKDFQEHKFFEVLKEGQFEFIKIPVKKLIAADYKDVYSADRRYDEYTTYYKYYIMSSDSIFHPIQLTKKSLMKMFPDKKELINNTFEGKSHDNNEDMVLDILMKL